MQLKIISVLFFLVLSSCATHQSRVAPSRDLIKKGECEKPIEDLKKLSEQVDGDQLVHLLEYASALQICGHYKDSNKVLIEADRLADQLDYVSVSRTAGAALLNEEMLQYKGDTFEKLFINVMAALNFIQLGDLDSAMVEVRRINDKFKKLNTENKKKFELNSLSQYLSGLIYELDNHYDDACISYKAAYKIDTNYRSVAIDMMRACWLAKRTDEFNSLTKEVQPSPEELAKIKASKKGEVVLIYLQGWGPRKDFREDYRTFPKMVSVPSRIQRIEVEYKDKKIISEKVYDVEKAAIATLEDDFGSYMARRIGARVAKEVMAAQLKQKDQALGQVAHLVMLASERPDLRQWSMLPQTVQVIRFIAPSDQTVIKVTALDQSLQPLSELKSIESSSLKKNKVVIVRSLN